ncbi:hypothetical protein AB0C84_40430 [Actinomadura sp. NPDC048955]|uniref:hypothetical protein n=1 Tax=Actinomadura sp. NPDC048955 TaxID=3158228 RepID=UPI0033C380AC
MDTPDLPPHDLPHPGEAVHNILRAYAHGPYGYDKSHWDSCLVVPTILYPFDLDSTSTFTGSTALFDAEGLRLVHDITHMYSDPNRQFSQERDWLATRAVALQEVWDANKYYGPSTDYLQGLNEGTDLWAATFQLAPNLPELRRASRGFNDDTLRGCFDAFNASAEDLFLHSDASARLVQSVQAQVRVTAAALRQERQNRIERGEDNESRAATDFPRPVIAPSPGRPARQPGPDPRPMSPFTNPDRGPRRPR